MKWSSNFTFISILLLAIISLAVIVKNPTHLGLDLRGGSRLVYQAQKTKDIKNIKEATQRAREVIERRLSHSQELGVAEPEVMTQGTDRIVVNIPEVKDPKRAQEIIGATARLEFRYIKKIGKKEKAETILTGADLKDARVSYNNLQQPVVAIDFTKRGGKIFADFTRTHVGETLAIFLDNQLLSSPTIQEPILTGSGQITGNFTAQSAQQLAVLLKGGALPVPLKRIEERTIGPTLGKIALAKSLKAGAFSIGLIFIFMILYYRLPGIVACIALSLYGLFFYALVEKIPIILTLPGIAGFILSLGMAVDANILIYERLREELREGKTLRAALDTAFQRAWTAILDSNVTTAISCAVLWYYGTGPVIGFAKTLLLGIACSMFTAITCTRSILHLIMSFPFFQKPSWYGYIQKEPFFVRKKVPFVAYRKVFFTFSALLFVPCMIALFPPQNLVRSFPPETGLVKGVDFAGGTFLYLETEKPFSLPAARKEIEKAGLPKATLQQTGTKGLLLRTKQDIHEKLQEKITAHLSSRFGKVQVLQKDFVGPIMSKDLTRKTFAAVILSSLLIMVYLAFRFSQMRYGFLAILALLHDVGIMVGAFALFGKIFGLEIDSLFVTSALTVVGFSVNDTIVVFDRIRENLKRRKEKIFSLIIDRSLQETFARSINTSFTATIPLVCMLLFGGETLKNFLLSLLIGFASGVYSSIFIASPLLVLFEKRKEKAMKPAVPLASPAPSASSSSPLSPSDSEPVFVPAVKEEKKKKKKKKKVQRRR